ncbi:MAG: hypothetical protein Q8M29_14470 [Bacteroidota bacterium]|nr:hypothetical protein [Bacteroidota bacterium]
MLEATTKTANISYDGKVLTTVLHEDVEVEIADVIENYNIVMDIIKGNRFVSLVITAPHNSITKEAREYSNNEENYQFCIAQAIVVKSLATRLLGNFYVKFAKTFCPQRMFNTKEDALTWLNMHWEIVLKEKVA